MSKKKFHLPSDDFCRVLLSELQPYHMPMIFSNEGFYNATKNNKFYHSVISNNRQQNKKYIIDTEVKHTIPYIYHINKDSYSTRELALIHPYQQIKFVDFYKKYYSLIIFYCGESKFSLRYPVKRNSTVYDPKYKNVYEKYINEYKSEAIDLASDEKSLKYASNFFSYRRYDFNYKFYESSEFIRLERKYPYLRMIDVARCFDSIYTHSISWAIRGKEYIKENIGNKENSSFDEHFDRIMQQSNYNETNGILTGSEVSRIFSEIIFQRIDINIIKGLEEKGLYNNKDYTVRRYVDDFCVFCVDKKNLEIITSIIVNELAIYKLYINKSKTKNYNRPFITNRSRNINELRRVTKEKMSEVLEKIEITDDLEKKKKYYMPRKSFIKNPNVSSVYFIKDLKSYWNVEDDTETGFSSYLLNTLTGQILKFIKNIEYINIDENDFDNIINYFIFIFDIALYAFSLEPKVTQSLSFSKLILIMTRFSKSRIQDYHEKFAHKVHVGLNDLLHNELSAEYSCMVERLNILLTLNDMGEYYLPSVDNIEHYLIDTKNCQIDYFSLITGLFIVGDKEDYESVKEKIINIIIERLKQLPFVKSSSEAMHLYMDSMSCPYLSEEHKRSITKVVVGDSCSQNNRSAYVNEYMDFFSKNYWFVNWNEIDILRKLIRKQLRKAY